MQIPLQHNVRVAHDQVLMWYRLALEVWRQSERNAEKTHYSNDLEKTHYFNDLEIHTWVNGWALSWESMTIAGPKWKLTLHTISFVERSNLGPTIYLWENGRNTFHRLFDPEKIVFDGDARAFDRDSVYLKLIQE